MLDDENKLPIDDEWFGLEINLNLKPRQARPEVKQQVETTVKVVAWAVVVIQAGSFVTNLILSKGL